MSNTVALIPQDKSNACWLAASTMMRSWKDQQSYTLAATLAFLDPTGTTFAPTYNTDCGLLFADDQKLVQALGLTALPPASYAIDFFFTVLGAGPIMAQIMFSANSNIAHMVVIANITGDGTPSGTMLQINDPLPMNAGQTYAISFTDFLVKFEGVVAYENNFPADNLTSQLFYYAQPAAVDSSSAASSAPDAPDASVN